MLNLISTKIKIYLALGLIAFTLTTTGISYYVGHTIGYNKGKSEAEKVIKDFRIESQDKIRVLEDKNRELSNKTTIEYIDRWNTIKEKEYIYKDQASAAVPAQNSLSKGWIYLHDKSALSKEADPVLSSNPDSSGVLDNQALSVIVSNYARCTQNEAQLAALQNFIVKYNSEIKNSNKDAK